jgi:hypothetical protein
MRHPNPTPTLTQPLITAPQAAHVPCDEDGIAEMIRMMDNDSDGSISWREFETFMMAELAAGKSLLSGEYVLPSGLALPFGAMISKMRRNRMMDDIIKVSVWVGVVGGASLEVPA